MIEIIGILASVFVLISFLFKSESTIRIINIVGAILFVIYGILINSISVWLVNGSLIFVHTYHLYKKFRR